MLMKKIISLFFCFSLLLGQSQNLEELAAELSELGTEVLGNPQLTARQEANEKFLQTLQEALTHQEAFQYPFDEVQNLSKLTTDDGKLRFFTWMMPLGTGAWKHFGMVMIETGKGKYHIEILQDAKEDLKQAEYVALNASKWFGALYYQIVTQKKRGETYYLLLGYDPHSKQVQRKIIDVATLDSRNRITFGAKIFETPEIMDKKYIRKPFRLIFEYSSQVSASIKYKAEEKRIVMDHLAPPDASQKNMRMVYGPDFSYDALVWKKGKWRLEEEIKIKTNINLPSPTPPVKEKRSN